MKALYSLKMSVYVTMALVLFFCSAVYAENIDPLDDGSQWAWSENVGWLNFEPSEGPGVTVSDTDVTGYVWAENIGWINLSPASYGGVTNDGNGTLSGYAWGENVGWISVSCENTGSCENVDYGVTIDGEGNFEGYAWGENIGWINFNLIMQPGYRVQTEWSPYTPPPPPVCKTSTDCNDRLYCNGYEMCINGRCYPNTNRCPDDGLFCNGEESCDEENDVCLNSGDPCAPDLMCDEESDTCVGCLEDENCDDGLFCNGEESCDEEADACMSSSNPCQDDGLFCNGEESCDEETDACVSSGDPCLPGEECDEESDRCLPPITPLSFTLIPDSALRSHLIPLPLFMLIVNDDPGTKFDRTSTEVSFDDVLTPPLTLVLSEDLIFTLSLIPPSGLGVSGSSEVVVTVTTNEGEGTVTLTLNMLPWILEE